MTNHVSPGKGPLAQRYHNYSVEGLFLRYARGQLRLFWPRLVFDAVVGILLGIVVAPSVGALAFLVVGTAELIHGYFLRFAYKRLLAGASALWMRRISTFSALLHACALSFGAMAPYWAEPLLDVAGLGPLDTVFTFGLLMGGTINAALLLPYNGPATVARLSVYGLASLSLLVAGVVIGGQANFQLQLTGLVILYGSLIWFLMFVRRSFSRTRSLLLTQALQQQELEGAYQSLLEQQTEAKKLALVARHANDSVLVVGGDGRVQWVNEAFTRLTGYSFDEVLGQNPGALLNHPKTDLSVIKAIEEGRREAKPFRVEILNRHKDGHDIWIETNQVPILDSDGRAISYIAVERDMTAAKQNAQQLEEARRAAEEGARAKSNFLATMSHEIRTPMNGVIGMAQLLEDTELDVDQQLYTNTILSSASTLLALINDILDLSKLEAEQITLNPCDFDLQRCCDETVRLLRPQAEIKDLELSLERDADLPRYLHGDDHRLRQILINLIGNAIKFTEKGRVRVSVDAEQRADGSVMLHCAIADTGIGIPKDMLTGIFERFSQADAAISRRFGGSGLGLAISRRLAEAMGGRITVSSEIGTGSCFTIELPFEVARSSDVAEDTARDNRIRSEGLQGLRLLVAEDNRVNRLLVQKFLKEVALELEFAKDGAEAVELAQHFKPDIILMDVSMPVIDGLEATRIIRSNGQPQPVIIALTANAFDTDREACLAAGMDEFLTKPINRSQLLDVLASFGDLQRRQRAG